MSNEYTPSLTKIRAEYTKRGLPPYTRGRGAEFDRAIAKIKAEAWDEAKNAVLRGIPYWHTDDCHHGFDIWEDEDGVAQEGGARIEVKKILDSNPYKEEQA